MRIRNLFLSALLVVAAVASAQQMPPIPVDKQVRIGKLDCGLTYYIRHNNWPEDKANFYIAQRVGSIQEDDSQRGLAHFLEHMAFNGSEHFPDSTLLEFTRSLGVEFGSDLNAYTSIDETVYRITDVPTKRATALDSCLLILKDWSNGLTLADKEIDKERGVIHQEWQLNEGPMQRGYQRILPKLYPGSKYGHRMPIGLMEIVDNFPYQVLRDYYKKWYRPDNQAVIVVGNVDVDHIEAEIKRLWAGVTVPANAAKVVDEPVPDNAEAIYVIDKDKEQQFSRVTIAMKHDIVPDSDKVTIAYLIDQYAKELITMMFNQRLEEATQQANSPFAAAGSYDDNYMISKTKDAFTLIAYAKEGQDLETLAALYREAQRVRQHGFTPSEFQRAKDEYLSQLEKRYANRNKIKNSQFGDQYRDNYLSNEPIPSIEDEYQIMSQLAAAPIINVDIINGFAKELISDTDSNLVAFITLQEKEGKTYYSEADMAAAIKGVRGEKIEAYVDKTKNEPLIAKMPKAGKIVSKKDNATFGYTELTLSNGARVVLKKTDFKENEVQFQAIAKGGKGVYGQKDFVNLKYFNTIIEASGLGNFSNNELKKALYGKQANVSMQLQDRIQSLGGVSVPKDIETLMQLIYLNFTAIAKDQDSYKSTMSLLEMSLKNKYLKPEQVFSDSLMLTIYNHEPFHAPMNASEIAQVNYDRILEIAKERFANAGDFVFYFVGNYDEQAIMPLIEQYIASLPGKKTNAGYPDVPGFANGQIVNRFEEKMESAKAIAFELWHTPVAYNVENYVLADAAGQVLTMDYLKDIREDASAAYSVDASGTVRRIGDKAQTMIQAICPMDPAKSDMALKLLAKGFADNSLKVDADKLAKVKENMLKNADAADKDNSHWMDVIDEYVFTGVDLHTDYKKQVQALTPEKVAAFIKMIADKGSHIEVVMTPKK